MKKIFRRAAIVLMFLVLVFPSVAFGVSENLIGLLSGKYFSHKEYCISGRCGFVVSESGVSLNSEVKKYFYPDRSYLNWPAVNTNYVIFDDSGSFCIRSYVDGVFTLAAMGEATINNIPDTVKVVQVPDLNAECGLNTY